MTELPNFDGINGITEGDGFLFFPLLGGMAVGSKARFLKTFSIILLIPFNLVIP
jgi:hypothetical protein